MAAPMKVTYGLFRLINRSNIGICELVNPKASSQLCANCCSTQSFDCHNNRLPKNVILFTKTGHVNGRLLRGSNSWKSSIFYRNLSCINAIQRQKQLLRTQYVINDTKYNNVRCQSAQSVDDKGRDHLTSNESLRPKELKENIWTIPNLLTLSRIVLTPVIGYLVIQESYTIALGLFTFAGLTDLLDGFIARNFKNQMSAFGTALDPLADKILITILTVTLATSSLIPLPLAVLIIGRDALLIVAGFVLRFISLPPPRTLKRYFDATNPTAKLMPSTLSKANTALQLSLVCFTLAAPVFNFVDHQLLQGLWYVTGATTFFSGLDYLIRRKTYVQFLQQDKDKMI